MSVVVELELEPEDQIFSTERVILKVYDRQFSLELRQFKDMGLATKASEEQYATFLRQGSMSQFLEDYAENGRSAYEEWTVPQLEAYFHVQTAQMHDVEVEVYNRLINLQGAYIPKLLADVRIAPQHAATELEASLMEYTEIRGIIVEHIPGFHLLDLVKETPESDWPVICDQAIDAVRKVTDQDFINLDLNTGNMLVRRGEEESTYQVFFIDFALCRFREASDSDEMWRERKRQADEEGAVGYLLADCIAYAKGKKGKKYKGNLPLPWVYTPSSRFDGEYIELHTEVL
ncbi:hypothetical protein DM02DRAFT_526524 [Periconia macrospinosa]|uniref:Protein kinase domain-containing protein n=1 Tax=Periconia macrospinosa TaxID=97972 RepID=A0A2V1DRN0_9PLEO|nr:hypothetical protein DM02DRAFT_526524 [Periconia macrospinosa]